ncbi:2-phospho-L-lactate guanylyltransferase, partial [Streptomyces sp. NPDC127079]
QPPGAPLTPDLPASRPGLWAGLLDAAAEFPRAFLPDAAAIGTTLLAAAPGSALAPAFGPDSRARHAASGAVELPVADVDSVRQDVDTGADLRTALALGVGPRTATVAARLLIPDQ